MLRKEVKVGRVYFGLQIEDTVYHCRKKTWWQELESIWSQCTWSLEAMNVSVFLAFLFFLLLFFWDYSIITLFLPFPFFFQTLPDSQPSLFSFINYCYTHICICKCNLLSQYNVTCISRVLKQDLRRKKDVTFIFLK